MTITINRCNALPVVREPNCIYIVKDGASNDAIIYITGNDAAVINKTLTRSEVADLISDNGRGIVTVSELPAPSALLAGSLMCLAATSVPYWCSGTAWVDITAISDQAQFDSLQAQITSLNSNKQSVSDKDKSGGYAGLTGLMINFRNAVNTITSFFTNSNTAARTYTFKDRNGIIADDTDLAAKANLDSPQFSGVVGVGVPPKTGTQSALQLHPYKGVQAGMFMSNLDYYDAAFRSPYNSAWCGFWWTPDANRVNLFVSPPNTGAADAPVAAVNVFQSDPYGNVSFGTSVNSAYRAYFYKDTPGGATWVAIENPSTADNSAAGVLIYAAGGGGSNYATWSINKAGYVGLTNAKDGSHWDFGNGYAALYCGAAVGPVISWDATKKITIPGILAVTGVTETVYNLTGTVISEENGSIQTKTLAANTTLTETLVSGQSVILGISAGSFTLTLPTISWVKAGGGGTAPTLHNTLNTWIVLWKVGTTLYGAYLGDA